MPPHRRRGRLPAEDPDPRHAPPRGRARAAPGDARTSSRPRPTSCSRARSSDARCASSNRRRNRRAARTVPMTEDPSGPSDDAALVREVAGGSYDALADLYDRHGGAIFAVARRLTIGSRRGRRGGPGHVPRAVGPGGVVRPGERVAGGVAAHDRPQPDRGPPSGGGPAAAARGAARHDARARIRRRELLERAAAGPARSWPASAAPIGAGGGAGLGGDAPGHRGRPGGHGRRGTDGHRPRLPRGADPERRSPSGSAGRSAR